MLRAFRRVLVAGTLGASVLASAGLSEASESSDDLATVGWTVFAVAPIPLFTVVDLYYAGKGSWARPAWAGPELGSGAVLLAFGAWMIPTGPGALDRGYSVAVAGFGAAFVLHGALSLANWTEPVEPTAWTVDDGTVLGLSGRF